MRVVGVAAVVLMACSAQAQVASREPVCQAERHGPQMITRVHFPDGYSVEGPWKVKDLVKPGSRSVSAVLDRIVETKPLSGKREMTQLPGAIQMTFSGQTMDDVLAEAASMWCETVVSARPNPRAHMAAEQPVQNPVI
jgi:hypothetical protein